MVQAEIITIGSELTRGMTVDTNTAWLSRQLATVGVTVRKQVTVPDDCTMIAQAVREAGGCEIILLSGGLGPTADDLTREALADVAGQELLTDRNALAHLHAFYAGLGRSMIEANEKQAHCPRDAVLLANDCGTAPGIRMELGSSVIFAVPGVPREMRAMFDRWIRPELVGRNKEAIWITRTVNCYGLTEAKIGTLIEDLMTPGREPYVGITAHDAVIRVSVTASRGNKDDAVEAAEATVAMIRDRLGTVVFGFEEETLGSVVGDALKSRGLTVAVAESCTGGLLAKKLTDQSGSSAFFREGLVTYSNEAKIRRLAVAPELIDAHGAVSEEVARAMAEGCRRMTGADFALSVTGIAGPTGGSGEKPVGLVYLGLTGVNGSRVCSFRYGQHLNRSMIRERSCNAVLNLLRLHLISIRDEVSCRGRSDSGEVPTR